MLIALAHVGARDLVAPGHVWASWNSDPAEVVLLVVTAAIYARAARGAASRGRDALHGRTIAYFVAGFVALALALLSPIDELGETIFAAHMAQHLMLITVAAPLLVLGTPPVTLLWALDDAPRRHLATWWLRRRTLRGAVAWITRPSVALISQTVALWFWHFPRPYQAALETPWIHALEHASFLGTALLFWWATLRPMGRRRLGYGGAILYMGITLFQSGALGALLLFSATPWYPAHAAGDALWHMMPLQDQQLAGLIMWIPASVVYIAAAGVLFLRWMGAEDRRERLRAPYANSVDAQDGS